MDENEKNEVMKRVRNAFIAGIVVGVVFTAAILWSGFIL